jgi:hypothetical protein
MKSFDEWKEEQERIHNDYDAENAWYAGQQSKQAEVDELQKRIDEAIYDLQHIESAMWEEQVEHVLMILKGDQS